jgi:enamine deaminase RidA (YjgF/YER057c/UK114 family)
MVVGHQLSQVLSLGLLTSSFASSPTHRGGDHEHRRSPDRPIRWACIRLYHFEQLRLCGAGSRSVPRSEASSIGDRPTESRGAGSKLVLATRLGNLVFLAGTGPRNPDGSRPQGKVGRDVTIDQAKQHARNVGLQLLAALRDEIGSLDKVVRFGRVFGMVNAVPDFADHPKVINGCSDLFVEVFGDRGRHARCAVGMGSLPFNMTVEIEAVVEVV